MMPALEDCCIRCPGCSRVCCIDNGDLCGCDEPACEACCEDEHGVTS